MNRTVIGLATAAVIAAVVVIAMIYSDLRLPDKTESRRLEGPVEKLTLWFVKHPFAATIAGAQAKGFFTDEGLETTLKPYSPHFSGVNVVLNGPATLASSAEPVVVRALINGEPIKVAAVISTSEMALSIVALKERGVSAREDLKGKRIGVTPGTSGEFNLHVLLTLSGIPLSEVQMVKLEPDEMEKAITSDMVDAVSSWEPHTTKILEKFGSGAVQFYNTPPVTASHSLVVSQKLSEENPRIIEKALRALIKAENFIKRNPDEACTITAAVTGMEKKIICRIWSNYNHEIKLDQNLLVRYEVLARWMMERTGTGTDAVPNFLDSIHVESLMAADPGKVVLVHKGAL
jgi:ABC-type nitrate/sulfonate/bicarbonate transport system substrate-binding protein